MFKNEARVILTVKNFLLVNFQADFQKYPVSIQIDFCFVMFPQIHNAIGSILQLTTIIIFSSLVNVSIIFLICQNGF
jgi:hypothetical protein